MKGGIVRIFIMAYYKKVGKLFRFCIEIEKLNINAFVVVTLFGGSNLRKYKRVGMSSEAAHGQLH